MNSSRTKVYSLGTLLLLVLICETGSQDTRSRDACRLLVERFSTINQGPMYPIVFEPIRRGRLSIWMGQSTIPSGELTCVPLNSSNFNSSNSTNQKSILSLDFGSYANKLEWTYYDKIKGSTLNGFSMSHCDRNKFKVSIDNQQTISYLNCNIISQIELIEDTNSPCSIETSCQECSQHLTTLINSYVEDLFQTTLNAQITENLYWQMSQLLTNQHFGQVLSVTDD